ncbi:hypothetical protein RB12382 [Rhodopirellula baltica SH 1]|uniref:Uncharacterized protein n=1 Tax=Rhodopirellula baltica (strain DSM 10527 / NCIMB 13988 / SH1) TaxID=243090 RepID=Q7UIR1_RHOBA|nr:hypothetical protein RB12382 [Rhodopirellula baltica SH 1]
MELWSSEKKTRGHSTLAAVRQHRLLQRNRSERIPTRHRRTWKSIVRSRHLGPVCNRSNKKAEPLGLRLLNHFQPEFGDQPVIRLANKGPPY